MIPQLSETGAAGERGYYDYNPLPNGSVVVMYTDYASQKRVPLCNSPSCKHNSDTCSAWYESTGSGMLPLIVGEKLILIRQGGQLLKTQNPVMPEILGMELNGSNKETIAQIPDGMDFSRPFAVQSNAFYSICTIAGISDQGRDSISGYQLVKVDIAARALSVLHTFNNTSVFLEGCTRDSLLLTVFDIGTDSEGNLSEAISVLKFNLSTAEIETIDTWQNEQKTGRVFESMLYQIDKSTGQLTQTDCITKQQVVLGNLYSADETTVGIGLKNKIDDRLVLEELIQGSEGIETAFRSLSITDFAKQDLLLQTDDTVHLTPLNLLAKTNDGYFLVAPTAEAISTQGESADGTMLTYPTLIYQYALIKQEDYWNNSPNYLPIETIT